MRIYVFAAGLLASLAAFSVFAKPAADRSHREGAPVGGWEFTSFEDACVHGTLWWEIAGYTLRAEDVEIVDTGIEAFGDRSLAPSTCGADDEPSFMLWFDPPMTSIMAVSLTWPGEADCWQNVEDVGDESLAVRFGPDEPMEPDEVRTEAHFRFVSGPAGFVACQIFGTADNLVVYAG